MNNEQIVKQKRTLYRNPKPGDFGIILAGAKPKSASQGGGTESQTKTKEFGNGRSGGAAPAKKRLTWAEQQGYAAQLQSAVKPKDKGKILAEAILQKAGTKSNIKDGARKQNVLTFALKAANEKTLTAALSDLESLSGVQKASLRQKKVTKGKAEETVYSLELHMQDKALAYYTCDSICRKARVMTDGYATAAFLIPIPFCILALLNGIQHGSNGVGGAIGGAAALYIFLLIISACALCLFQRVAPVLALFALFSNIIANWGSAEMNVAYLAGVFLGLWLIFGAIEALIRVFMRK